MRAIVIHAAKDLRIEQHPDHAPAKNQVAVRIRAGGVCGSDLHYFHHGGFGAIRLKEPMVPGHEVAGEISAVGEGVTGLVSGDRVAINPSLPCLECTYCEQEIFNQCLDMRFYGSAMRFPHVQGAFAESIICEARQCVAVAEDKPVTDFHSLAFAEPLSVGLHAIEQAKALCGSLAGKKILVSGCGPIGLLTLMAAKREGAREVVALDISDFVLQTARDIGVNEAINTLTEEQKLAPYSADKGYFDIVFEASGVEPAIHRALDLVRPRGCIIQLGLGGDIQLPMNTCVAKEIRLGGSFRFHQEFDSAVSLISSGALEVSRLLSARIPVEDALSAFEMAGDRSKSIKVQIAFN